MQDIRSSNPPVVTGICSPNKSQARYHQFKIADVNQLVTKTTFSTKVGVFEKKKKIPDHDKYSITTEQSLYLKFSHEIFDGKLK